MGQITIRNLEDEVIAELKAQAKRNRRSLEAEVRAILAGRVKPDRAEAIRQIDAIRERSVGRYHADAVAEIRALLDLALQHGGSLYDAVYVDLARSSGAIVATADSGMADTARRAKVRVATLASNFSALPNR